MPDDIRSGGTVLSRLDRLAAKLDDLVEQLCGRDEDETSLDRTARTLSGLLRDTGRIEEMKQQYDPSGQQDSADDLDGETVRELEQRLLRKIDRLAAALAEEAADQRADENGDAAS